MDTIFNQMFQFFIQPKKYLYTSNTHFCYFIHFMSKTISVFPLKNAIGSGPVYNLLLEY